MILKFSKSSILTCLTWFRGIFTWMGVWEEEIRLDWPDKVLFFWTRVWISRSFIHRSIQRKVAFVSTLFFREIQWCNLKLILIKLLQAFYYLFQSSPDLVHHFKNFLWPFLSFARSRSKIPFTRSLYIRFIIGEWILTLYNSHA